MSDHAKEACGFSSLMVMVMFSRAVLVSIYSHARPQKNFRGILDTLSLFYQSILGLFPTSCEMPASHTWEHDVDSRISIIADGLSRHGSLQQSLPGLKGLLDDYLDPKQTIGTDADQQGFHRRLLQVFRDSPTDSTYENWLQKLQPDEQKRVADFVGGSSAKEVCGGFKCEQSLGVREHTELLHKVSPVIVNGLSNDEEEDSHGSIFRQLVCCLDLVPGRHKHDSVIVSKENHQDVVQAHC